MYVMIFDYLDWAQISRPIQSLCVDTSCLRDDEIVVTQSIHIKDTHFLLSIISLNSKQQFG